MQINLDDQTIARLQKWTDPQRGVTEEVVINRALDQYEAMTVKPADQRKAQEALARLKAYRGTLKDLTVEQMLLDRRLGLR